MEHEHNPHKEGEQESTRLESRRVGLQNLKAISFGDLLFLSTVIVILLVAAYVRIPMLKFSGFYEPDGFYHFSIIRAAVNRGFNVPDYSVLSGWPVHTLITEPKGLYWVTLLPYFFLRFFGVSYYTLMRWMPVFFGLFDVMGAYFLSRFLSRDRTFGVLAMTLVALSSGNAARTSALIYRGDGFVTIFLIMALYFLIRIYKENEQRSQILFMFLAGLSLSLSNLVWNGAPFATVVYALGVLLIIASGFITAKEKALDDSKYALGSLFVWFVLVNLYKIADLMRPQTLTGLEFLAPYLVLAVAWYVLYYAVKRREKFSEYLGSVWTRLAALVSMFGVGGGLLWFADSAFIYNIFVNNGFIITSSFAATIQELIAPSFGFLFASFGITLFMSPMALIMGMSTFVAHQQLIFWTLMMISFAPYFFMRAYDSGRGWLNGNARIRFELNEELLVLIAYFAVTGYLQLYAIRFNSLISIPLAIFSAYTVYWVVLYFKRFRLIGYVAICVLVLIVLDYDIIYSQGLSQADSINPRFLSAMAWLKNNSASSSVMATLWPDGSVVEGIANRTSVTDSSGSQNATKADPFAAWVLNSTQDPQLLTSNLYGKPDYLVARYSWLSETSGIFGESGLNASTGQNYGYAELTSISEAINATDQVLRMSNAGSSINVYTKIHNGRNITSYIQTGQGISPFTYVAFYNQDNSNFSLVRQSAFNLTNNATLLIIYSAIPNPHLAINITGMLILEKGLAYSNLIKLLYYCNANSCLWDNAIARLQLVYMNSDTKIFRVLYYNSS